MGFSFDDDLRLFDSFHDPELASKIVHVVREDMDVQSLELDCVDDLSEGAWSRLGCILGQNSSVKELDIWYCKPNLAQLGDGLGSNRHIQDLDLNEIDLREPEKLSSLAPFLINNPCLRRITMYSCNMSAHGLGVISTALLSRTEDTLEELNLSYNHFGGVDLDPFVQALNRSRKLKCLLLGNNEIGLRGCTSLSKLLKNQSSSLEKLYLDRNSIDDDCTVILAGSLATNTKLKHLGMHDSIITKTGWSAVLNLVCKTSSISDVMRSNHTFDFLDAYTSPDQAAAYALLGSDDANLLSASLNLNKEADKLFVARRKILWSHARGNLNLGEALIDTSTMLRVLAWIGNDPNETNAIQYHKPPLPEGKIEAIRLDSMYRIVRRMPDLCICKRKLSKRKCVSSVQGHHAARCKVEKC